MWYVEFGTVTSMVWYLFLRRLSRLSTLIRVLLSGSTKVYKGCIYLFAVSHLSMDYYANFSEFDVADPGPRSRWSEGFNEPPPGLEPSWVNSSSPDLPSLYSPKFL
jgi:hypothetical protein